MTAVGAPTNIAVNPVIEYQPETPARASAVTRIQAVTIPPPRPERVAVGPDAILRSEMSAEMYLEQGRQFGKIVVTV
jgi:hypothetical protein